MDPEGRQRLIGAPVHEPDPWEQQLCASLAYTHNRLQRATLADILTWLPDDLLVKLDRMAMANSLEGRAPFLSPALVDAAIRLPEARRMTAQQSKVALREVAALLLPRDIVERRKQGFILPMANWLQQWLRRVGSLRDYFDLPRIKQFDSDAAVTLVKREMASGHPNERLLFSLVVLAEWHRLFFRPIASDAGS
jgi:Asparagine synthase (glutamine-hydrolyzing)